MADAHPVRFGLKSMLAAMSVACVVLALIAQPIIEERLQQELLDQIVARGAKISLLANVPREDSLGCSLLAMFNARYSCYRLYSLDLTGTSCSNEDLNRLVPLRHIKDLKLAHTQISDVGIQCLQNLPYLTKLDLGETRLTDEGIMQLSTLRNLCSLRVVGTSVTYEALEQLDAALPYAHFCEEKAIEELKAAGIQVVNTPRFLDGDSKLGMSVIRAGEEVTDVIVGMNRKLTLVPNDVLNLSRLRSVRCMTFHTVTLGSGGLEQLRPLPKMKDLQIWNVNLSDRDLEAIARQSQLESLTICGCREVSNQGLEHLGGLKNLQHLQIDDCDATTKSGMAALQRNLPNCGCSYTNYAELQRSLKEVATGKK